METNATMLNLVFGRPDELSPALKLNLAKYRHKIFVEDLGWSLPATEGLERDQFDHADTVYVVATNAEGDVSGCGRLLPTHKPYLLGEVFPMLMNGAPLPCTSDVWELSRFAISAPSSEVQTTKELWENTCCLMAEVVRVASAFGARRLIAFSVLGNERLLRRMGVNVHRAAPPQMIDGKPTLPFWIEIDQQTCEALKIDFIPDQSVNCQRDRSKASVINASVCIA